MSERAPSIHLISFGYKYGIPAESDLVFDVRFLPNPFFVETLRHLDGTMAPVRDFVMQREESREFLHRLEDLLDYLVPLYAKEGKSYLTITLGCTGGKHRSVCFVEALREHLQEAVASGGDLAPRPRKGVTRMTGLVVVSQGPFAAALLESAATVAGPLESVEAVCLSADEDVNEAKRRIESAVTRLASRGDVLVMTDMFGGTPADLALSLLEPGRIEVVTGVSLSMIVKFAAIRGTAPLAESAGRVAAHGRKAIRTARSSRRRSRRTSARA